MRAFILGCALLCGGLQGLVVPAALAHSGHGDEFVQNGSVGQVKSTPGQDQLLGIATEKPLVAADGQLSVPSVAIVDADGKLLVFVHSGKTYDPVFIRIGPVNADRTVVLEGVTANEEVVVSGALSLYAESHKKDRLPVDQQNQHSQATEQPQSGGEQSTSPPWLVPGVIGIAFIVLAAAVFGLRGRGAGSKDD